MEVLEKDNNLIIKGIKDFDLKQTLECGQCFRFYEIKDNEFIIIAKERLLIAGFCENNLILYNTTKEDYNNIWKDYFDLDRDYASIKKFLLEKDNKLLEAINEKNGVRILNQDFFEMVISFIVSQNNRIPRIKKSIEKISEKYGEKIEEIDKKSYFKFPTLDVLSKATQEELRECGVGFRADYIIDACSKIKSGVIDYEYLLKANSEEAIEHLKQVKGIGDKVANCIVLFGLSKRNAFPVDVWIKRIMEELYFGKDTKKEDILKFAKKQYGEYGGYAQQYLFYYARDKSLKEKKTK